MALLAASPIACRAAGQSDYVSSEEVIGANGEMNEVDFLRNLADDSRSLTRSLTGLTLTKLVSRSAQ